MSATHENAPPPIVSVARQSLMVLGLLALTYLGGRYYFYERIAAHQNIGYYAGQEALLASEITIVASQLAVAVHATDAVKNGMAYVQLADAVEAMERNHNALMGEKIRAGILYSFPGQTEQKLGHSALITSFIAAAHSLLQADGKDSKLSLPDAKEIISNLEVITNETQQSEQRALFSMTQFNLVMFVAAITFLIWLWFARVRRISQIAVQMTLQAKEVEQRLRAEEERAKAMLQFSTGHCGGRRAKAFFTVFPGAKFNWHRWHRNRPKPGAGTGHHAWRRSACG